MMKNGYKGGSGGNFQNSNRNGQNNAQGGQDKAKEFLRIV